MTDYVSIALIGDWVSQRASRAGSTCGECKQRYDRWSGYKMRESTMCLKGCAILSVRMCLVNRSMSYCHDIELEEGLGNVGKKRITVFSLIWLDRDFSAIVTIQSTPWSTDWNLISNTNIHYLILWLCHFVYNKNIATQNSETKQAFGNNYSMWSIKNVLG